MSNYIEIGFNVESKQELLNVLEGIKNNSSKPHIIHWNTDFELDDIFERGF